jgi:hypothetical protein
MHAILGPSFRKKYNSAFALMCVFGLITNHLILLHCSRLESGALYCFCLILWVASLTTLNATGEFVSGLLEIMSPNSTRVQGGRICRNHRRFGHTNCGKWGCCVPHSHPG